MPESAPVAEREAFIRGLRDQFPDEAARDPQISPIRGGRRAADALLAQIDPVRYGRSRNYLDGAVTRLSPYLRHGVLTLAEVRDAVLARVARPEQAGKLINELAWRDYYQRIYRRIGERIWEDLEPYKTGFAASSYADELPADIIEARTGLACVDAFIRELYETGYLHNHARMWLAAYVVHWRRVRWQAGAAWFLLHLLDGDPASNNLSWQWVASTFSHKPYIFNRENLERYSDARYCRICPVRGRCDFEGDYEALASRLFGDPEAIHEQPSTTRLVADRRKPDPPRPQPTITGDRAIVWVHADDLNPRGPALTAQPEAAAVWVWDDAGLRQSPIGLKRVVFLADCLAEMPVQILRGDPIEQLAAFADANGANRVVSTETPDPRLRSIADGLRARGLKVDLVAPEPFVRLDTSIDLTRFSRYWRHAEKALLGRSR